MLSTLALLYRSTFRGKGPRAKAQVKAKAKAKRSEECEPKPLGRHGLRHVQLITNDHGPFAASGWHGSDGTAVTVASTYDNVNHVEVTMGRSQALLAPALANPNPFNQSCSSSSSRSRSCSSCSSSASASPSSSVRRFPSF